MGSEMCIRDSNIGEIEGVAGDEEIVQDWWVVEHARQVRPY